jgi:hypothetical protein
MYTRENPSPEYVAGLEISKRLHANNKVFSGRRVVRSATWLYVLFEQYQPKTMLDYGSGRGVQYGLHPDPGTLPPSAYLPGELIVKLRESLGSVQDIALYDPAFPPFAALPPGPFDAVISTDALDYVPDADLVDWVLPEVFGLATKCVFISSTTIKPRKVLAAEAPWERTVAWWLEKLTPHTDKPHYVRLQVGRTSWEIYASNGTGHDHIGTENLPDNPPATPADSQE